MREKTKREKVEKMSSKGVFVSLMAVIKAFLLAITKNTRLSLSIPASGLAAALKSVLINNKKIENDFLEFKSLKQVLNFIYNKKIVKYAAALLIFTLLTLPVIIADIPSTINIQGKLTDSSGTALQGTYNFTFRIYDNFTSGNVLWSLSDTNITTDSNGIYDIILTGISLNFSDQYYLGVTVGGDAEMAPRINLSSVPYSFRANVSDNLDETRSYTVENLTADGYVGIGTTSPAYLLQVADTTGAGLSMNVSDVLYVNGTSGNVGIGTTGPQEELNLIGTFRADAKNRTDNVFFRGYNVEGTLVAQIKEGSNWYYEGLLIDGQREDASDGDGVRLAGYVGSTGNLAAIHIRGAGGTITSPAAMPSTIPVVRFSQYDGSTDVDLVTILQTGNVGIGTTSPSEKLTVKGNASINNTLYVLENGNVGIGDSSPLALLTVGSGDLFQVVSTGHARGIAGTAASPSYSFTSDTYTGMFSGGANILSFANGGNEKLRLSGSASTALLEWYTSGASRGFIQGDSSQMVLSSAAALNFESSSLFRMTIDTAGNVGINTTSPQHTLDVVGSANVSTTLFAGNMKLENNLLNTTVGNSTITSAGGSVIIRLG